MHALRHVCVYVRIWDTFLRMHASTRTCVCVCVHGCNYVCTHVRRRHAHECVYMCMHHAYNICMAMSFHALPCHVISCHVMHDACIHACFTCAPAFSQMHSAFMFVSILFCYPMGAVVCLDACFPDACYMRINACNVHLHLIVSA